MTFVTAQHSINDKTLNVFCASLHEHAIPEWITQESQAAFKRLAPYIKNSNQVLYIRDIPYLAIDGKYPGGHCYNEYEAMIALTDWESDKQQVVAAINHELHHMARWQNPGYGETLGGAILSEGVATFYEELISGWSPPWAKASFTPEDLKVAVRDWHLKSYDHSAWFFQGPRGRWVGYSIGYQLAKKLFAHEFDLAQSITIEPAEALAILKQLS